MTKVELTDEQKKLRKDAYTARQKGATLLTKIPSENPHTPEVLYEIMLGSDLVVFCKCKAYEFNTDTPQICKHLKTFIAALHTLKVAP